MLETFNLKLAGDKNFSSFHHIQSRYGTCASS